MKNWTLLQTLPASQTRYTEFINTRFPTIELYYPVHEALSRPSGYRRPIRVTRPTYPGYIFAKPDFTNGEHERLRHVPFRVWFIRFGQDIETIPEAVIIELQRLESNGELNPEPTKPTPFKAGQRVAVHTPTARIEGIIRKIMQLRALVDTEFCKLVVPVHQLASLEQSQSSARIRNTHQQTGQ